MKLWRVLWRSRLGEEAVALSLGAGALLVEAERRLEWWWLPTTSPELLRRFSS